MADMYHLLKLSGLLDSIPNDSSVQVTAEWYAEHIMLTDSSIQSVIDLGCGTGNSLGLFRRLNLNVIWFGIDIIGSPEVMTRTRTDAPFVSYDGIRIPLAEKSVDLVYSKQVLEHVRYPSPMLREVARILRPGGYFIGSTSHLEPYHSYSYWNYTPYGFQVLIEEAGLQLVEIRPSIDALSLVMAHILRHFYSRWWATESPLNWLISVVGKIRRVKPQNINAIKLLLCGQFCFLVQKG